jgi:ATPase subunit of ABC transporter with duplicated ATPase domains
MQKNLGSEILQINSVAVIQNHEVITKPAHVFLTKGKHLLVVGPNGIGKSTLIDAIAKGKATGVTITPGVRVGYYSQDFSTLQYSDSVWESLSKAINESDSVFNEQTVRSVAAGFLISGDLMVAKIRSLSEGQKGLLSFARLVLLQPGLLILDEPTNHINFRHIPVIAKAISEFEGSIIMVSHVPEFVSQIKIHEKLDLEK